MRSHAAALLLLLTALPALADEQPVELAPGPGHDEVVNNCAACHSLDYIRMNAPFMSPAVWQAEVRKMIDAFGAPIDEADAKAILGYLIKNYGG